ncbi:HAMP domain-containing protein [Desulfovibrio aminophilus]|nr:histidine kinase dimerization/phosphoacceptor domain -containing protein [Desulfovibrio aminophilus]MCM0755686.1 HAMP domain-containing protein [Desulfovibrio aminophilus]
MRAPRLSSIRAALFTVVLGAMLPALALLLWTGAEHARHLKEESVQDARRTVESLAQIQERITENTRQMLATLAVVPEVRRGAAQGAALLRTLLDQNPQYTNVLLVDARGDLQATAVDAPMVNIADRKHFQDALAGRGFAAGEYIVSRTTSEPAFPFTQALLDTHGNVSGVLVAAFRLSSYGPLLDKLRLPPDSMLGIVDHAGRRLYRYPAKADSPLGAVIKAENLAAITSGPDADILSLRGTDGLPRLYAYKKLRLAPGAPPYMTLVLGLPESPLAGLARSALTRNVILLALVTVLTLFSAWFLAETVLGRRLQAITATAARISEGDLAARTGLPPESSDIGQVAQALDRMAEALQQREREQAESAETTARSLREKETLLKEIHHRVKNNLQLILSLVRLQALHDEGTPGPDFPIRMENRIRAMALVHEMLYESDDLGGVDLAVYVPRLTQAVVKAAAPPGGVQLSIDTVPARLPLDQAVPFALLLNELLTNACKYGLPPDRPGRLDVSLARDNDGLALRVADNGPGLPQDFDPLQGPSLGMRLVTGLADQLGGALSWTSDNGAAFTLHLPGFGGFAAS